MRYFKHLEKQVRQEFNTVFGASRTTQPQEYELQPGFASASGEGSRLE